MMEPLEHSPRPTSRQERALSLLYGLGCSRIRASLLRFRKKPVARFLAFHDTPPWARRPFEANLRFLKRRTNVISLDDFFLGRLSRDKINVVITFDDGYKGWLTEAVPLLVELGLPAAFFISSGYVGLPVEHDREFGHSELLARLGVPEVSTCLDREDVGRIAASGLTVGGHTRTHARLSDRDDPAGVREEIVEDKRRLEEMTGREVRYFAYPFGSIDNPKVPLPQILKDAGYRAALTTISGFNTFDTDPYRLNRELTRASMDPRVFRAIVYGTLDIFRSLRKMSFASRGRKPLSA